MNSFDRITGRKSDTRLVRIVGALVAVAEAALVAAWRPGARAFLEELRARSLRVIIFTTQYADDVRRWLRQHDLHTLVDDVTDRKPAAHVFVDDRAVWFRGDFVQTLREIDRFAAHWEPPA
jgi:hypothetical protein